MNKQVVGLQTLVYLDKEFDVVLACEAVEIIQKLKYYFIQQSGNDAEENMARTFMQVMTHYKREEGDLKGYITKLAKVVGLPSKYSPVPIDDFTYIASEGVTGSTALKVSGAYTDISMQAIENFETQEDKEKRITALALDSLQEFVNLCEALITKNTSTVYYSEPFKKSCFAILETYSKECKSQFNEDLISVYLKNKEEIDWFLALDEDSDGKEWFPPDYQYNYKKESTQLKLCDPMTDCKVVDADTTYWYMKGHLVTNTRYKAIYRVRYYEVWKQMCELAESEVTNEVVLWLNGSSVTYTLGNNHLLPNAKVKNVCDVMRSEILTNLLMAMDGRLLSVGSQSMYILCTAEPGGLDLGTWHVKGIDIHFDEIEDITALA